MALFQGLFFCVLGLGLLGVAWRSLSTGWLPFGARGPGGRLELRRDAHPWGYWMAFALYAVAGVALAVLGARILFGAAAPLPLQ